MCSSPRTAGQLAYIAALAGMITGATLEADATTAARTAADQMRAEGLPDDPVVAIELVEEAVAQTGFPDDNRFVKRMREGAQQALKIKEAIASGVDPRRARMIGLMGGDPRRIEPIGGVDELL